MQHNDTILPTKLVLRKMTLCSLGKMFGKHKQFPHWDYVLITTLTVKGIIQTS